MVKPFLFYKSVLQDNVKTNLSFFNLFTKINTYFYFIL